MACAVLIISVEFKHIYEQKKLHVFDVGPPRSWKLLAGSKIIFSQWYSAKVHAFKAGTLHFHAVTIVTRPCVSWCHNTNTYSVSRTSEHCITSNRLGSSCNRPWLYSLAASTAYHGMSLLRCVAKDHSAVCNVRLNGEHTMASRLAKT